MKIELEINEAELKDMIVSELARQIVENCSIGSRYDENTSDYRQTIRKDVKMRTRDLIREVFAENREDFAKTIKETTLEYLKSTTNYSQSITRKTIAETI